MSDKVKTAEELLADLAAATTPLAKSATDMVTEAALIHTQAINYDKLFSEAIAKAAMPENFMKKPKKAKAEGDATDADDDADCDDAAKAETQLELAKAAHEQVLTYIAGAEVIEKAEDSPWTPFVKTVQEYYAARAAAAATAAAPLQALSKTHAETMTKASDDLAKAAVTAQVAEIDATAGLLVKQEADSKDYLTKAVYPIPETVLEKAMVGPNGWMPIKDKASLMGAMAEYAKVDIKDQPPAYAHIFNAAAALGQKLPEGWHTPVTLEQPKGSTETARVRDITQADKAAAMAKGVQIIGPTAGLLGSLRSISATSLLERMQASRPEDKAVEELKAWMTKGEEILKGIVATEAESIRMLDLPTFPEPILKADHWATITADACRAVVTDEMPVERRAMFKDLGGRFDAASEVFKKAANTGDLLKVDDKKITELETANEALTSKLDNLTKGLVPLARAAQEQKDKLKKSDEDLVKANARIVELEAQPMPSKGRVGEGGIIEKGDDGKGGTGTTASDTLKKVNAMPPGAERARGLLSLAYQMRAEEQEELASTGRRAA